MFSRPETACFGKSRGVCMPPRVALERCDDETFMLWCVQALKDFEMTGTGENIEKRDEVR